MPPEGNRDLAVSPGEFVYTQDTTKGIIKTSVGPTVVNQAAQDQPVIFEGGKFQRARSLEEALRRSPRAGEGQYLVLENPSETSKQPDEGGNASTPPLAQGRKVNIPGPKTFALWPGQVAKVIDGHTLRSNQYLVVSIYNEDEARKNWQNAVVKTTGEDKGGQKKTLTKPEDLTIGRRYIIPGTLVSFYIPPTGVEVVPEGNNFIRDAVTLERLEHAILVDEDGNKRYERGPQVVFPKPTEEFFEDDQGNRKFKAIELNGIQGLHIKVIAAYEEGEGESKKTYKEGDEFFITGKDCAIYYPRPEHSIVSYGDRMKHYAVAVPAGEGRYVMDRASGKIETVKGPCMLLPNPVDQVIVRRVLTERQVGLWYPGNEEAKAYNRSLRQLTAEDSTGYVSESAVASYATSAIRDMSDMNMTSAVRSAAGVFDAKKAGGFDRGTKFTKPRELTLDTKYDGVPVIQVWTGYAVMIVNKSGDRRVVVGPATVLLDYDETLEILTLSTGKPKTTDTLLESVYLRVKNNKVSDIVTVQTSDHVSVDVKLSFRVDFEKDSKKWFEVENYVKALCDHVRSMLKGSIRKVDIEKFYADGVAIVRDIILGVKPPVEAGKPVMDRKGLSFDENGLHVLDVEVLDIAIKDANVKQMLDQAQFAAVSGNIQLAAAEKTLTIKLRTEEIAQATDRAVAATLANRMSIMVEKVKLDRKVAAEQEESELEAKQKEKEVAAVAEELGNLTAESRLARDKAAAEQRLALVKSESDLNLARMQAEQVIRIEELKAECDAQVAKLGAVESGFSEALTTLSNADTLTKVAEALSVQRLIGGQQVGDVLGQVFKDTRLEGVMTRIMEMATANKITK